MNGEGRMAIIAGVMNGDEQIVMMVSSIEPSARWVRTHLAYSSRYQAAAASVSVTASISVINEK